MPIKKTLKSKTQHSRKVKAVLTRTGSEIETFQDAEQMKKIKTSPEIIEGLERASTPAVSEEVSVGQGRNEPGFQTLEDLGAQDVPAGAGEGIPGFQTDRYVGLGEVTPESLKDEVIERPSEPLQRFKDIQVPTGGLRDAGIVEDVNAPITVKESQSVQKEMSDERLIGQFENAYSSLADTATLKAMSYDQKLKAARTWERGLKEREAKKMQSESERLAMEQAKYAVEQKRQVMRQQREAQDHQQAEQLKQKLNSEVFNEDVAA